MLTRARSLFSRVFSFDSPSKQIRLEEIFDDINDDTSDDNDQDNMAADDMDRVPHRTADDHDDFTDSDDDDDEDEDDEWSMECRQSPNVTNDKSNGKYERQINEGATESVATGKAKGNVNYARSHEKTKQTRLVQAMQMATSRCNVESMKRLLNNVDININHRDQYGMSYLEHAILMGSFDMVNLLVSYGCDLYQGDSTGHSYLYVAIETTTHKSLPIIHLLLESNCSCLRLMDIATLTSPQQLMFLNSQDFLLLNTHLLSIFKYHIRRMVLGDVLNLTSYLITTNMLLCKNDEHYGLSQCAKAALNRLNHDYVTLFVKALGVKHLSKLEQKLIHSQTLPSSAASLKVVTIDDIQPYVNRMKDLSRQVPELRNQCRLLVRQNLKNLKVSTLEALVSSGKLRDYLLYTPI